MMKKLGLLILLLSSDFAFGQVTYVPVPVAFPQIAVGGDPAAQNYITLLQLVNNNSSFTTGHIQLFSDSGSPLPVLFDGQGPQSTMDVKLDSGQSEQIQITLNGAITAGWMLITYTPSDALTTVILQFRSGTTLLSEIGVAPAFDTMTATDLAIWRPKRMSGSIRALRLRTRIRSTPTCLSGCGIQIPAPRLRPRP
jgi:hypothetical protein